STLSRRAAKGRCCDRPLRVTASIINSTTRLPSTCPDRPTRPFAPSGSRTAFTCSSMKRFPPDAPPAHNISNRPMVVDSLRRRLRSDGARWTGDFRPIGHYLRPYIPASEGIGSMVGQFGRDWRVEPGFRISRGAHPAVDRLRDGSYLMLYETEVQDRRARREQ